MEPVYEYRLEVPSDMVGRAMTDIQKMYGTFQGPEIEGEMSVLTGVAPVVTMGGYQSEVTAYTRGRGRPVSYTHLDVYKRQHLVSGHWRIDSALDCGGNHQSGKIKRGGYDRTLFPHPDFVQGDFRGLSGSKCFRG